ncbi:MAG: nitrous oxide reductase family maturation protein NosD [Polyangiaceae bacterium]|nr:nitrous oxide reductase family maturation protein NosD [Polyangiaceae bacterium]
MIRGGLGLLALVGLVGLTFSATTRGSAPSSVASETNVASFEELRDLVADPNGPREIMLGGHVYHGDLEIKRPLVLRGVKGTVLEGTGTSTVLLIDAKDVTIDGVTVRHSGHRHTVEDSGIKAKGERIVVANVSVEDVLFGISFESCQRCVLERSHVTGNGDDMELRGDGIKLWEANDSIVRDNVVDRSRDIVVWYTRRATLERNTVRRSRYGTHFMYAHDAVVRDSHLENNIVGIFVMYSMRLTAERNVLAGAHGAAGMGIGFKESDAVVLRGNWIVANTLGTYLDTSPRDPADAVRFEGNVIALNDVAIRLHGADKGIHFYGNDFRDNATLIEVDGGGDALGVDMRGNHFTDYEGYDLNRDGIGDVAYEVKTLSSELREEHPSLKFFHGTVAMGIIDAVAHAVPIFAAQKLMVDPVPLMNAPKIEVP